MNYCKRRVISGALVILLLLAGWYIPNWLYGTEARVFAAATPAPDLVIESVALSPESPSIGDTLTFSVTIKNQGDSPSGMAQLTCSIEGANLPTAPVDSLDSGAVTIITCTWKAQAGPHIFQAVINSDGSIAESNKNNNDRTFAFSVLAPDLAIGAISWTPANPVTGDKVTFTVKVTNQGNKRAGVSQLDFSIDGSSRGFNVVLGMEPGTSVNETFVWIATSGAHKVRATADAINQVLESDEANNTLEAICSTALPDLIINSVTVSPQNPSAGDNVTLTVIVKNQGSGKAEPSSVSFYVDDSQQDSIVIGFLSPGETTTVTFFWIAGSEPHTFKFISDASDTVKESDETNNILTIPSPVALPDLIIQDITWSPSAPQINSPVFFTITVKNQGKCKAGYTELKFGIDTIYQFTSVISELAAGDTTTVTLMWVPLYTSFTVKAAIDTSNLIKESNESNNTMTKTVSASKLTPSADLIVQNLAYSPGKPLIGGTITVTLGVKNQGTGAANPSYADIYIDGKLMNEVYIDGLNAGASLTKDINLSLEGLPFKDTYILRVLLDCKNTVSETNELNNEKEIPFSILAPDMVIQSVRWSPEAPSAGDSVTFNVTVKNQGDMKAGSTYISYYVDKVFMGKHRIDDMEPGTTVTRIFIWVTQKDSFAFTAIVDEAGEISEKDESNNSRTITLPAPDLLIDSITWTPVTPTEFVPVTFTATIRNRGYGSSAGTLLYCYFDSAAPISLETGEISPGGTAKVVFTYAFISGNHTLRLVADGNDAIAESDESNNEKTVSLSVQPLLSSVPTSPANSSVKTEVKTPASTAAGKTSQATPLQNNTLASTPVKDIAGNITAPPPKWQSIVQNKLFIIGFGVVGVGAIVVLLFFRKKTSKHASEE